MKKIIAVLLGCTLLTGCIYQRSAPIPTSGDHAAVKLAEAADSASNSLNELARIQAEATPAIKGPHELPDPSKLGLRQVGTVDWSGPIEPLLEQIAQSMSYRLRIIGRTPKVALIVTVSSKNMPMATILRNIDYQATNKAFVAVYPQSRVIELRYATT